MRCYFCNHGMHPMTRWYCCSVCVYLCGPVRIRLVRTRGYVVGRSLWNGCRWRVVATRMVQDTCVCGCGNGCTCRQGGAACYVVGFGRRVCVRYSVLASLGSSQPKIAVISKTIVSGVSQQSNDSIQLQACIRVRHAMPTYQGTSTMPCALCRVGGVSASFVALVVWC